MQRGERRNQATEAVATPISNSQLRLPFGPATALTSTTPSPQGLPANIDLLRSGCDDEETWLQEYCCQFLSDAQNYIPVELISTCVHEEASTEWADAGAGVR